jgi:hypothetical protein
MVQLCKPNILVVEYQWGKLRIYIAVQRLRDKHITISFYLLSFKLKSCMQNVDIIWFLLGDFEKKLDATANFRWCEATWSFYNKNMWSTFTLLDDSSCSINLENSASNTSPCENFTFVRNASCNVFSPDIEFCMHRLFLSLHKYVSALDITWLYEEALFWIYSRVA